MPRASPIAIPIAVAGLGIALFSAMDAVMKGLTLAAGAYNAMLWRLIVGMVLGGIVFLAFRGKWPPSERLRLHLIRGTVAPVLAFTFFWGIARVPLAEGIALSFIAPLIALYLAAVLLKEQISRNAILASALGLAGVAVIVAGKLGEGAHGPEYWRGVGSVLISAIIYAYNLILQRQQAMVSSPVEIVFFQHLVAGCVLALAGLLFSLMPASIAPDLGLRFPPRALWEAILLSALLTLGALWLLSWAYARAQAQVLVTLEYTAFLWASYFGWVWYAEAVTFATLIGAVLIVFGCLIAGWQKPVAQSSSG